MLNYEYMCIYKYIYTNIDRYTYKALCMLTGMTPILIKLEEETAHIYAYIYIHIYVYIYVYNIYYNIYKGWIQSSGNTAVT